MPIDHQAIVDDLNARFAKYTELRKTSKYDDLSDKYEQLTALVTSLAAAIERFAPPGSQYVKSVAECMKIGAKQPHTVFKQVYGIAIALRDDYLDGRLKSVHELIHADVFGDFLDMAQYFLDEKYKDPAAVMAGSVLEEHLRKLCDKLGVQKADTNGRPKKASVINSELRAAGAYDKNDEKNVTAWLGLRNDAAHGDYAKYGEAQVNLLIASVRDFITRNPA